MRTYKCRACGNTKHFHRTAIINFITKKEMDTPSPENVDYTGDIVCSECYENNVVEVM